MSELLTTLYYGNTIAQWFTTLFLILASILVARAVYWLFRRWLKFLTRKTRTRLDDIIVDMVEEPVVGLIILIGVRFSLGFLTLPEAIAIWPASIFQFCLAAILAWFAARLYDAIHREYLIPMVAKTDTDLDDQLLPLVRNGIRAIIWALGIVIGLNNAGYNVGAILAGLGIGGLALALAAQDTVANIFGGITIFLQKPFKIGDRIEVTGINGWIREIGLRTSVIQDVYDRNILVPNKTFIDNPVKNIDSQPSYWMFNTLRLRLDTPTEKVELAIQLLYEILRNNELLEKGVWINFEKIGEYSLDLALIYGIKLWRPEEKGVFTDWYHKVSKAQTQVNLAILKQFEANQISLALPTQLRIEDSDLKDSVFVHRNGLAAHPSAIKIN